MKNKNIKIIVALFTIVVMIFSTFNIAIADGDKPKGEISVSQSGANYYDPRGDEMGSSSHPEDFLTNMSDSLTDGKEVWADGSRSNTEYAGFQPGDTITGEMPYVPTSDGEPVESLSVTVQAFQNSSYEDVLNSTMENLGLDRESAQRYMDACYGKGNVWGSEFGTYCVEQYDLTITFDSEGNYYIEIPPNMPSDYIYAITQMQDPVTGEMITFNEYARYFFTMGDPTKGDPRIFDPDYVPEKVPTKQKAEVYSYVNEDRTPYKHMEPERKGKISSENDKYDVETAIPTSENLDYTIYDTDDSLYDIETRTRTAVAGVHNLEIDLVATYSYKYEWYTWEDPVNKSGDKIWHSETRYGSLSAVGDPAYSTEARTVGYDVPKSNIYPLLNGNLTATQGSYVLDSGTISLTGGPTAGPTFANVSARDPSLSDPWVQSAGSYYADSEYEARRMAQEALDAKVGLSSARSAIYALCYAALTCDGGGTYDYRGLHVTLKTNNGVTPEVVPASGKNTKMIPSTYPNGTYVGGGSVNYTGGYTFEVIPNNVIVHTPVVNEAKISWIKDFINQKINIDKNVTYLILDGEFEVEIPDAGTHNSYKGYGTRTYNSYQGVTGLSTTWGKIKDIKFPFDVYIHGSGDKKYFIPKDKWLSEWKKESGNTDISIEASKYRFTVPVWVDEKTYEIETRVIAENAVSESMYNLVEENFNSSLTNYVATKKIPVEIIGKIYDLRISASNDPGWAQIYSQKTGNDYIKADEFPFGQQGQNRVTQYKYAPKLGYTFVFNFKTKGRKSNNIDVSIQPEGFYFVGKNGGKAQEVDLYYDTTTTKNVKILPADTNVSISVTLRDAMYKVPPIEFTDSVRIYNSKYNYASAVRVGTFAKMNLPENLRLCYNNFAEYVNKLYGIGSTENSISQNAGARDTVIGSVGHWYAGYRLPASTKAVPKGTDIQTAVKNNSFLNDGYILVKFNLNSYYNNGTGNYPYLHYMGPEALNEAGEETGKLVEKWPGVGPGDGSAGFKRTTLPNGNPADVPVGSVAIFEANLRSSNDVEIAGTH